MKLKFHFIYFILSLLIFLVELLIAAFARDTFIRPVFGDFLVVMLMYCTLKAFTDIRIISAAVVVLITAYAIEISQYFELGRWLGLEHSTTAHLIIGQAFSWGDIMAYTLGIVTVLACEKIRLSKL